jgi:hypothetical protein
MAEVRPVRAVPADLAPLLVAVTLICAGIILATAQGWVAMPWADAWSLVAWVVIVATITATWSTWRGYGR